MSTAGGIPRQILERAESGDFELVIAAHIRDEIERGLCDKFDWSLERVAHALIYCGNRPFRDAQGNRSASRDETDNRILDSPSSPEPR